jgi:hypothetical protein
LNLTQRREGAKSEREKEHVVAEVLKRFHQCGEFFFEEISQNDLAALRLCVRLNRISGLASKEEILMMKRIFVLSATLIALGCKSDDPTASGPTNQVNPPVQRTVVKTGTFSGQNGYATSGGVEIVRDSTGAEFVLTRSDFRVSGGAGTITAWLTDGTGAGNLNSSSTKVHVGTINSGFAGVYTFPIPAPGLGAHSHVVMFCQSARVNFGNAALQNP